MIRKRLFDLALTVPGLIALSPVLVLISVWIKLDSRGPVFFKQTRVGLHEKTFDLFKFRTMVPDAESLGLQLTTGDDQRITGAGRFLRKFKLDELPQLFNVVRGEMSLVGPRPEVPRYVACYPDPIKTLVLSIPPGITDRASIEFRNENSLLNSSEDPERTYIEEILPIKLGYYAEYARHHSVIGDLYIILKTFRVIMA